MGVEYVSDLGIMLPLIRGKKIDLDADAFRRTDEQNKAIYNITFTANVSKVDKEHLRTYLMEQERYGDCSYASEIMEKVRDLLLTQVEKNASVNDKESLYKSINIALTDERVIERDRLVLNP